MADKYTDDKLYKVVRKDGSHLNTKVNPDGTKSALQFTDDNNDLNGPVDLIEVDEEELIRTEYIHCLLYTSPSPRDGLLSRMPSSA